MNKSKFLPHPVIRAVPSFILVGGISFLILLGASLYYSSEAKTIRENKQQELQAIAGLKIRQVVQWRNDKIAVASFLAKSSHFSNSVEAWLNDKSNLALRNEIIGYLLSFSKEAAFGYSTVYLASIQGEGYFSAEPGETILDPVTAATIREASNSEKLSFTDFYRCSIHDIIHYDIIAPVVGKNDRPVAALVFRIDPDDFLYPLIQTWPTSSKTSETLLVRKDGTDVLYLNELRLQANTALTFRMPLTDTDIPAVRAILGFTGILEGNDYRDVKVLSYIAPVPGTPWFMVAKVDTREIYAEIRFRAILAGVVSVVLILFVSACLAMIYNFRQKNIYKKLLESDKKLEAKQEEYKTALYSIGDGVMTTDVKGTVVQMNPVAEQLTGWLESEARGKPLEEIFRIINEGTRTPVVNPVQKVIREGLIVGLANHTVLISKNGKEIPLADSGAPIKNEAGEIYGAILVFHDQTPEREASRALQQSEAKFRSLFENSPIGMSISGVDGYSDVNMRFCTMLGYDAEELKSKKWQDIAHPDDIQSFSQRLQLLLEGKNSSTYLEKRYLHKNGTIVWADVSIFLQRDEEGKPQFFITAINDITKRKQSEQDTQLAQAETRHLLETAEKSRRVLLSLIEDEKNAREEIRHLNTELEQRVIERTSQLAAANKELEAFSYSVSHDLRTPLRHISSYAEILMTKHSSELSEKAKHYLETIKKGTITMGTLIDNLLEFSRMGKTEMLQRNCPMDTLLASAMDQVFGDSDTTVIQFEIDPLPVVFCDFNLMVQVWMNLLSNAVKYSRGKSPQKIRIGYTEDKAEFVFFIRDNGIGFEMEYMDKLFGVFQRLHAAKEFEGTGIGLANVRRIISRHHGKTWAESTPGQGATFYFSLPKNTQVTETASLLPNPDRLS